MRLGHEIADVVEWVVPEVRGVSVGDRVVVHPGDDRIGRIGNGAPQGGLTPLLLVPHASERLFPIPDRLDLEVAAFAKPLAVGMHAVDQAELHGAEPVCVIGCGPIGLAAIATLADRDHDQLVGVDLSARRRELALGLGAQAAVDPTTDDLWTALADLHGTTPFLLGPTPATPVFIEASGAPRVLPDVIDHASVGSRVVVVALHHSPIPTNYLMVLWKELKIRGSIEYPPRFDDAIDLLARRDLSSLLTDRVPLDRFADALELLEGSRDCGKVLVTMD